MKEGEVPVFWACGVTPQTAVEVRDVLKKSTAKTILKKDVYQQPDLVELRSKHV